MTTVLNTEPIFASEAQETFTAGCRVYTVVEPSAVIPLGKGTEGTYAGAIGNDHVAVVDFDTPSSEPWRLALSFAAIRNLYHVAVVDFFDTPSSER